MLARTWSWLLLLGVCACGSKVSVDGSGGGGASSTTSGTSSSTSTSATCSGSQPACADSCGSDYFPAQADCVEGAWLCPPGTVNPADCPSGTCWGAPLPCEKCGPSGWECQPTEECAGSCGGLVCAECTGAPSVTMVGACTCQCDASGQYTCDLSPGCCNKPEDCGDVVEMVCVEHVCKLPVDDGCWTDADCGPNMKCDGASICPCSYDCDQEDKPGSCVPI